MKFIILLLILFCKPADPNYRVKPLLNDEYTGFISRNFFQAVIEIPITREEMTIIEERNKCKKDSIKKRDEIILPILKKIALESKKNEKLKEREEELLQKEISSSNFYKIINPDSNKSVKMNDEIQNSSKKLFLNKGEFNWFLSSMFLFKEDYSKNDKCIFVFRKIEKGLFEMVENTTLGFVGDIPEDTLDNKNKENSSQPQNSNPLAPGLPQVPR